MHAGRVSYPIGMGKLPQDSGSLIEFLVVSYDTQEFVLGVKGVGWPTNQVDRPADIVSEHVCEATTTYSEGLGHEIPPQGVCKCVRGVGGGGNCM